MHSHVHATRLGAGYRPSGPQPQDGCVSPGMGSHTEAGPCHGSSLVSTECVECLPSDTWLCGGDGRQRLDGCTQLSSVWSADTWERQEVSGGGDLAIEA